MNFSWNNKNNQNNKINIKDNYRKIIENFCNKFYATYDNNINELYKYFYDDAYITCSISTQNPCYTTFNEFTGCNDVINKLYDLNILNFTHHSINISGQPLDNDSILLNIHGIIYINNSLIKNKYIETIVLQRNNQGNFYINNLIIKILN